MTPTTAAHLHAAATLLSALRQAPTQPADLDGASWELNELMRTAYHPAYRLHRLTHRFEPSGDHLAVYAGEHAVGHTGEGSDVLHARWLALGAAVGEPEVDLAGELPQEAQVATSTLAALLPGPRARMGEVLRGGADFVSRWWTAEDGGGDARAGRTAGAAWVQVRVIHAFRRIAELAADRVTSEAPPELQVELAAVAASGGESALFALADRFEMSVDDVFRALDAPADAGVVFFRNQVLDDAVHADEADVTLVVTSAIEEMTRSIAEELAEQVARLADTLRGDLYEPELPLPPAPTPAPAPAPRS
jgi:hypothetical protein